MQLQKTKELEQQKPEISQSKYELTLSEFPVFNLAKRVKNIESIIYEDTITGKDKEEVKRKWEVTPAAKFGIGTASTFETLFDLMQIWKENKFVNQYINFGSIYHLVKRRGIPLNSASYTQMVKDLKCLVGMTITATNAFWDNEIQAYVDSTFHLFDQVWFYKEKADSKQAALPFARIKASDVLWGSIKKNSLLVADFDSQFFHSLTPIEQRMALYLSKILKTKKVYQREMLKLAEQIPIQAKQSKHVKQELKKACEGLIKKGFKLLEGYNFKKAVDGKTELIVFFRKGFPVQHRETPEKSLNKEDYQIDLLVEDILEVCQDEKSRGFYINVARRMPDKDIYQALAEVKEIKNLGEIKQSAGALFTMLIKKYAQEREIKL